MPKTVRDRLLDTLENLDEGELRKFKAKLNEIPVEEDYNNIPRGLLQKADALDLSGLLIAFYTEEYAVRLTAEVLEAVNCKDQAAKLFRGEPTGKGACSSVKIPVPCTDTTSGRNGTQPASRSDLHFIEKHREALIQRTATVEGILDVLHGDVLDDEQYQKISAGKTNQEKMRELYKLVPSWNCRCKDKLYEALKLKSKFLIADLEGQ
ncbi:apoptosis-associated speck-like protein containing a CARD [Rhineura floridana]|uniref:apoptosis-associated speck-like protein containing a CARD n=1 Tax=Rhineura floridana TaxID=261503 RepID=UPI002AC85A0A|nr:apoptosis-associated speck-like protein containing a CARD [Rhineura floridana]